MRLTTAALLGLTILTGGLIGCEDNDRHYDRDDYRGDRIGSRDWDDRRDRDWDRDRDWNRERDWDRDRRDWDRDHTWDRDRDLRRDHDHRGEGLMDPDFDRNRWDNR